MCHSQMLMMHLPHPTREAIMTSLIFCFFLFVSNAVHASQLEDSAPELALQQTADLVLYGGTIWTGDPALATAEAIAVQDGVITAIGSRAELVSLIGPETRSLDLETAYLYPGFFERTGALAVTGQALLTLQLDEAPSLKAVMTETAAWLPMHADPVIVGYGWDPAQYPERRGPSRFDLDLIAPQRPVLLYSADRRTLAANSAAIELAGVTKETALPGAGAVQVNALGELTGVFEGEALTLFEDLIPARGEDRLRRELVAAADHYRKLGWATSLAPFGDPVLPLLLDELTESDALKIRLLEAGLPQPDPAPVRGPLTVFYDILFPPLEGDAETPPPQEDSAALVPEEEEPRAEALPRREALTVLLGDAQALSVGRPADFTVLDIDLLTAQPEDILTGVVLMTFVGGKTIDASPSPSADLSE